MQYIPNDWVYSYRFRVLQILHLSVFPTLKAAGGDRTDHLSLLQ